MVGGLKTGAPGTTSVPVTESRLICSVAMDRQSYQSDHARGNVESPRFTSRLPSREAYPPAVPATDFDRHDSYGVQAVWKLSGSESLPGANSQILGVRSQDLQVSALLWVDRRSAICVGGGPRFDACGGLGTGVVVSQRRKMSVLRRSPSCLA